MAPDAGHDEVKHSYLDLALRFRPDQMGDASDEDRERARFRRDEINEAWAVLRSPADRAHYDDVLRAEALADGPGGIGRSGGRSATALAPPPAPTIVAKRDTPAVITRPPPDPWRARAKVNPFDTGADDDAAELDPADTSQPPPAPRRIRWAPLIVGGAVLVAVLFLSGVASRKPDLGLNIETVERFGVGTCVAYVTDPATGTAVLGASTPQFLASVPCTDANDGQVVARIDFPLPCPRGRAVVLDGSKQSLCLEAAPPRPVTTRPR